MSKQPEAIPAVRRKPERARHPEEANSSPLMDTINILLKASHVKHKFLGWMTGFAFQPSASCFGLSGRGSALAAHVLCALPPWGLKEHLKGYTFI